MCTAFVNGIEATKASAAIAVDPPLREVRALRRVAVSPRLRKPCPTAQPSGDQTSNVRVALGDPERLEQEARQSEEEQDPEEDPVADHVGLAVVSPSARSGRQ